MIVVTGAAGFVGSNLVRGLNAAGRTDIIAVDDLTDGARFRNLVDCDFLDYLDKDEFMASLPGGLAGVERVFHQGACSDTLERGRQVHAGKQLRLVEAPAAGLRR